MILSRLAVYQLAMEAGLDDRSALMATAIAEGESGRDPEMVGDIGLQDDTWGPSIGLWQVRSLKAQSGTGQERDAEQLKDPAFNARSMVAISSNGFSWQPWTMWKNGTARRLLPAVEADIRSQERGIPVRFVSRDEWGARPPNSTTAIGSALVGVACHWEGPQMGTPVHRNVGLAVVDKNRIARIARALASLPDEHRPADKQIDASAAAIDPGAVLASADCYELVAGIQAYHMDSNGWADIAYNGVVCPHGYVFEGRGPGVRSAANGDATVNSTHYALCFLGGEGDTFTDETKDGYNDGAVWLGIDDGEWVGHRDLTQTACPGDDIYGWVHSGHPRANAAPTPSPSPPAAQEDDMTAYAVVIHPNEGDVFVPTPPNQGSGGLPWGKVFVSLAAPQDTPVRIMRVHGDPPHTEVLGNDPGGDVTVTLGRNVAWEMDGGDDGVIVRNKGIANVTALVEVGPSQ